MIHLEIEHPEKERLVLPLSDGVYLFPSTGNWGTDVLTGRVRLRVKHRKVVIESLGSSRGGDEVEGGVRRIAELTPGESVQIGDLQMSLRLTSRAPIEPTRLKPLEAVTGGHFGEPDSRLGGASTAANFDHGRIDRRLRGRDRWILISLYKSGRLGRRTLGRVVTAYRNARSTGGGRSISDVLGKQRFLGREFDGALAEVDAGWCLSCRVCRRVFEPEGRALETARCMECDRRLDCGPKAAEEVASERRSPARISLRFDRLPAGVRLGNYKVMHLLGVGGYGAVYQAEDTHIGRRVALKVFPIEGGFSEDVLQEASNVAAFPSHANLVMVYHVGRALGLDYICYEYVHGRSLAYHIERRTRLSLDHCLSLFRDSLQGLAAAHKFGVIHRDLKPDNILLVRIDGKYRAKVTDFGLGRQLKPQQEGYHSRTIRGAPEYLAPEQFRAQMSSVASDLYSLGVTFYHVITGQLLYHGSSDLELAERHQEDPIPSLVDQLPGCPVSLDRLFHRLLSKDPKSRPASAAVVLELLQEIEAQIADSRSEQKRSFGSRSMVVGSIVLVAAVLGLLASQWSRNHEGAAEKAAIEGAGLGVPQLGAGEIDGQGVGGDPGVDPGADVHSGAEGGGDAAAGLTRPGASGAVDADHQAPSSETRLSAWENAQVGGASPDSSAAGGSMLGCPAEEEASRPRGEPESDDVDIAALPSGSSEPLARVGGSSGAGLSGSDSPDSGLGNSGVSVVGEGEQKTESVVGESGPLDESFDALLERVARRMARYDEGAVSTEELPALRRLALVDHLFFQALALPGVEGQRLTYVQAYAHRELRPLVKGSRGTLLSRVFRAQQVEDRVDQIQELLEDFGLDAWVEVRLPQKAELLSGVCQRPELPVLADAWEWIEVEGEIMLYDHGRALLRRGSEQADFQRPSTYRLCIELREVEALAEVLASDLERLGE